MVNEWYSGSKTKQSVFKMFRFLRLVPWERTRGEYGEERAERDRLEGVPCIVCGELTADQSLLVDPQTLRRRKVPLCDLGSGRLCSLNEPHRYKEARKRRAQRDWKEVTDPVENNTILPGELPEQHPGRARAALRAFVDSGKAQAVVLESNVQALNEALRTLGLEDEIYAEQRDQQTVLRRVEPLRT